MVKLPTAPADQCCTHCRAVRKIVDEEAAVRACMTVGGWAVLYDRIAQAVGRPKGKQGWDVRS